ncbi:2'-5' RNA ligase family protein [Belnapia sp. T18]|uniref:2'-5' RNA ligase family protein n=1 Tax=Belnapia arida TaxID=2804533 RepID=A0ABS1U0F7_9PROT|nr:2'-5' RNA ligase family protein [Belnapia arida]MBL6078171.1 2'-5' RNA ligase family protein [Belnapia arida]
MSLPASSARPDPLILTLALDPGTQARFDRERRAHFPPERNHLAAHLTLFHHLPGEAIDEIAARLAETSRCQPGLDLAVEDVWMMGRGVAYRLRAPGLVTLRAGLAAGWQDWLTPQDRQPLRPHVTIQNKVTAEAARALHGNLRAAFTPFTARGTGLLLWHYRGGPWEAAGTFPFA